MSISVHPVPCLKDNYAYLVVCDHSGQAAVVDPSEAAPPLEEARRLGLELRAVWNTHHHWDHVGGNLELARAWPGLEILGHEDDRMRERIPGQTQGVVHGSSFALGQARVRVLHNPGHTLGAISFIVENAGAPCAFSGDTLFAAGCGRVFEGDAAMMHASLNTVLGSLPDACKLYFGHEYTQNNLRFAQAAEPQNQAIASRLARVRAQRAQPGSQAFTTPSTMAEERQTNPFLRCHEPQLQRSAREQGAASTSPTAVFAALRAWKDRF